MKHRDNERDSKLASPSSTTKSQPTRDHHARNALGLYITSPASFPSPARVVSYDENFVTIHDAYPKSSVHLLLIPRDMSKTLLHPFDAFSDLAFLKLVRSQVDGFKKMVASELRRRYGHKSKSDAVRQAALSEQDISRELPDGRDWKASIITGVHAQPSMNHLHVHILSVDRVSECLRHRKHYNSFTTPFFVPIEDFPLDKDDVRRQPSKEGYLEQDLICWRCGKDFGRKFKQLKSHLEEEFENFVQE